MRGVVRRHRVACFLVVTYAFTWCAWLPLALAHRVVGPGFEPLYVLGLLGPLVGAITTTAIADGEYRLRELVARMLRIRVGWRWWLVAAGLPLAVYAVTYVVLAAYSMFLLAPVAMPSWTSLGEFTGFPLTNAAVLLVWLVVINGLGEETGWRGFLLPRLQRNHSALAASLLVAACWAAWHLPAFFISQTYRAMPPAMIPMFLIGLASASVFLTWLYNHGRHSIALAAVFHGVYNLFSGTVGARGAIAAVETTAIVIAAVVIAIRDLRASHGADANDLRDRGLAPW